MFMILTSEVAADAVNDGFDAAVIRCSYSHRYYDFAFIISRTA